MADVAWSDKRKALIPGEYENGMFVPFNGDDPIPADQVVASKPQMKIKALNDAGELEEMSLDDAIKSSSRRNERWLRTKGVWWIAGITGVLWTLSMIGARQSTVGAPQASHSVVLADELKKTREAERYRVEQIKAGGERSYQDLKDRIARQKAGGAPVKSDPSSAHHRWIVNHTFSACPSASDWFPLADALDRGDLSVDLPSRCRKLRPGEIVHAPSQGNREAVTRDGHSYERIELAGGRIMWTDSLDEITASDLGVVQNNSGLKAGRK